MGIGAAQLRRPPVHHADEHIPVAHAVFLKLRELCPHMLRQGVGHLVGGFEQHAVKTVLHGQLVSCGSAYDGGVILPQLHRLLGKGNGLAEVRTVFQHQKRRHHLGDGRWKISRILIFPVKHRHGIRIHDAGALGADRHVLRPGLGRESPSRRKTRQKRSPQGGCQQQFFDSPIQIHSHARLISCQMLLCVPAKISKQKDGCIYTRPFIILDFTNCVKRPPGGQPYRMPPMEAITGANTREMTVISLIRMLMEGPEVSLKGSPTVSPTTPALWGSEPFPP